MATGRAVAALIVAAGRGLRAGGEAPKQYQTVGDRPLLAHALEAFCTHPLLDRVITVIHPDDRAAYDACAALMPVSTVRRTWCAGGASRQTSVHAGLERLAGDGFADDGVVLIHDAARPFLSEALVTRAVAAAAREGAAVPVLPIPDTVARLDGEGGLVENPPREHLRLVQTPQVFRFDLILAAHRAAVTAGRGDFTDDAGVARWHGAPVASFPGDPRLYKITTPADFTRAAADLAPRVSGLRVGTGYDVHAFGPGDRVMLGGIAITHERGLIGHSDADPLLHALTDAVLGALADGDIGQHFPPSDPQWKGAASEIFLAHAVGLVRQRGGRVLHLDGTLVCEAPKIGPHRDRMRAEIARIAGLVPDQVGLKATTSERLGFTGRREGIAAFATATVLL